jgi:hypothetical protein
MRIVILPQQQKTDSYHDCTIQHKKTILGYKSMNELNSFLNKIVRYETL